MDELLMEFMHRFYGYGNPKAKYWFIGLEEGGGENEQEINQRVYTWNNDGQAPLHPDIAEFHQAAGLPDWFAPDANFQPTWTKLIRFLLAAENLAIDNENIRNYQIKHLGRDELSCLLELYPLPRPGNNIWHFNEWFGNVPELADIRIYQNFIRQHRINGLSHLINEHQPRVVVFYGITEINIWNQIAIETIFEENQVENRNYFGNLANTNYLILQHPNAHGISNAYYEMIGQLIHQNNG